MIRSALAALTLALLLAAPALASEERPTLAELEGEVMCPTCKTTLELSDSPIAERIRAFISDRIAAGDTKSEIKDALVDQFGEAVLSAPPKSGFNLVAWVLPLAGLAVAGSVVGALAWRWTRGARGAAAAGAGDPGAEAPAGLDPDLERRLDEELARFDG